MTRPSPSQTRAAALRIAAKVAITASLLGCTSADQQLAPHDLDVDTDDSADCCHELVLGLSEVIRGPEDVGTPTAELATCCEVLLAASDPQIPFEDLRACCYVVGGDAWWMSSAPACTPWGPPMPPEMGVA